MSYDSEVLADTPDVYWKLGEPSGTVAADASGNANDGTYVNAPTFGDTSLGLSGGATGVLFDGNTQGVQSVGQFGPTTYAAFAIEAILRENGYGASGAAVFGVNTMSDNLQLTAGSVAPTLATTAGSVIADSPFVPSVAHHVVATYDGTNGSIWVDGVKVKQTAGAGTADLSNASDYWAANDASGNGFLGVMARVAFYPTALSPARIAAHFAAAFEPAALTEGPTVRLVTSRALVVPHQIQRWILPIICKDHITTGAGDVIEQSQDVATIRDYFIGLRRTGTPVVYQEGDQRHLVVVRDVSFPEGQVERWGVGRNGLQGILMVTLDSTEA